MQWLSPQTPCSIYYFGGCLIVFNFSSSPFYFAVAALFCCYLLALHYMFLIRLISPPAKMYRREKGSRGYSVACLFLLFARFALTFFVTLVFSSGRLRKELYLVHDGLRRD
ncbi:hypothetical protein GGI43DRAFT_10433 [Trichoderma evansii]